MTFDSKSSLGEQAVVDIVSFATKDTIYTTHRHLYPADFLSYLQMLSSRLIYLN